MSFNNTEKDNREEWERPRWIVMRQGVRDIEMAKEGWRGREGLNPHTLILNPLHLKY